MTHTAEQLQALIARCEQFRGAEAPEGYPNSLALCVVDSIQSTGVRYAAVEKVVGRYVDYREKQKANAYGDGVPELLATFEATGGPERWAEEIGNGHRTSTRAGAPLKAVAIRDAAGVLDGLRIATAQDLRDAADDGDRFTEARKAWCGVVGQRSGITWRYAGMLAGVDGVKPDRMICRFVTQSLYPGQRRRSVDAEFAEAIVKAAAGELGMTEFALDHAIWRFQRGRR
ncbi:hypothetical protein [Mycobacteroides abscessus]|uniref:hypothetical protein n=1 Tax=Mycobacteroides abscessus TaxID=36809 RepID=UPI0018787511|nr:hypothetical protein [Mycobacteroides abscessus]